MPKQLQSTTRILNIVATPKDCKFCGKTIRPDELFSLYIKHINKKKEESWFHEECYAELMKEMGEDSPFDR
ncbi:hypothetical protein [Nitrosopumilus piranensis]|uniref:hypothetical protein n=1 Tax=Nitrosopumilus piranensis TaxID=1582439 RepID=UPI0011E5C17E|nr:hypothetical protein [Nitrosopumilus piranensis]